MDSVYRILVIAGVIILAFAVIGLILTRLYRRATKDISLIRTGFGGEKVVINGGILVIPVLHELMQVRMTTLKLEVNRTERDALITQDKIRVDVVGLFHIKVRPDAQAIAAAAQTLGQSVNNADAVKNLFDGKLVSALRSVAATMTFEHLHANRADFITKVQEAVQNDLDMNGFQLESVNVTHFDQTNFRHLDENNVFDAEGMTEIAKRVEQRRQERNDITVTTRVAMEQRNLEGERQSLEIAQQKEQASLQQVQTLAASRSEQEAAVARSEAESMKARESARIETQASVEVAETKREGEVKAAVIERDRTIELARIDTRVKTQEASERESAATAKASEAQAMAVRAEEQVITARATEQAERAKSIAVIGAQQRAEEQTAGVVIAATAERNAAQLRAEAALTEANANAESMKILADADERANEVRAEGERSFNEATNTLSPAQTSLLRDKALFEALPAILVASAKGIEKIDKITILDAHGLHGSTSGGEGKVGTGNLADDAVAAAMKYRVGGPLIDALMGELGIKNNTGLDALLPASSAMSEETTGVATPKPMINDHVN